jgi:hypothetical protein
MIANQHSSLSHWVKSNASVDHRPLRRRPSYLVSESDILFSQITWPRIQYPGMKIEVYVSIKKIVHRYRVYQLVLCVGRLCDVTVELLLLFYDKILAVNLVKKRLAQRRHKRIGYST